MRYFSINVGKRRYIWAYMFSNQKKSRRNKVILTYLKSVFLGEWVRNGCFDPSSSEVWTLMSSQ